MNFSLLDTFYVNEDGALLHAYVTDIKQGGLVGLFDDGLFFVPFSAVISEAYYKLLVIASEVE